MGRAAGGGPAAHGAWANSNLGCCCAAAIGTAVCPLNRSSTGKSAQPAPRHRLRESPSPSVQGGGHYLKPAITANRCNHAIILPGGPARTNGSRVTFASVLSDGTRRPVLRARARIPAAPRVALASACVGLTFLSRAPNPAG